jgi:hypothetical protein
VLREESAAKPAGKKQTARSGWTKTMATSEWPLTIPRSTVVTPVRSRTVAMVVWWGRAKVTHGLFNLNVPGKGVFMPYIEFFNPEKTFIRCRTLSELIPFVTLQNISAFRTKAKEGSHLFNKKPSSYSDTGCQFVLTFLCPFSQGFLLPALLACP